MGSPASDDRTAHKGCPSIYIGLRYRNCGGREETGPGQPPTVDNCFTVAQYPCLCSRRRGGGGGVADVACKQSLHNTFHNVCGTVRPSWLRGSAPPEDYPHSAWSMVWCPLTGVSRVRTANGERRLGVV